MSNTGICLCHPPDGRIRSLKLFRHGDVCGRGEVKAIRNICPGASSVHICPVSLCSKRCCPAYPNAECRINPCNGCKAEFYVGQDKVDCSEKTNDCQKDFVQKVENSVEMVEHQALSNIYWQVHYYRLFVLPYHISTSLNLKKKSYLSEMGCSVEADLNINYYTFMNDKRETIEQLRKDKILVGQYLPRCRKTGDNKHGGYHFKQCKTLGNSTLFCFCVDKNGKEISGTVSSDPNIECDVNGLVRGKPDVCPNETFRKTCANTCKNTTCNIENMFTNCRASQCDDCKTQLNNDVYFCTSKPKTFQQSAVQ